MPERWSSSSSADLSLPRPTQNRVVVKSNPVQAEGDGCRSDVQDDVAQLSDIGLVVAITRRQRDALAEVYRRHGERVHRRARVVVGESLADEVVQEVFLRLWQEPERFQPHRGVLRTFLLKQAHGRAVDLLRSENARRARESADVHQKTNAGAEVEDAALARLAGEDLWRALSSLHDGERDAIALAYFAGHTYREVADLLEQPEGTVKGRIRSGLARLRAQLSDDGSQSTPSLA